MALQFKFQIIPYPQPLKVQKFFLAQGVQKKQGVGWDHILLITVSKDITNLNSILKSRDITMPTNLHLVKVMVFIVVLYRCESWTIMKAEH